MQEILTWFPLSGVIVCLLSAIVGFMRWMLQFGQYYYVDLKIKRMKQFLVEQGIKPITNAEKLKYKLSDAFLADSLRTQDPERYRRLKREREIVYSIDEILKCSSAPVPTPGEHAEAVALLTGITQSADPTKLIEQRVDAEYEEFVDNWNTQVGKLDDLELGAMITDFIHPPRTWDWIVYVLDNRKYFADPRTIIPLLRDWIDYISRGGMLGLLLGILLVSLTDPKEQFNQMTAFVSFSGAVLGSILYLVRVFSKNMQNRIVSIVFSLFFIALLTFVIWLGWGNGFEVLRPYLEL